MVKSPESSKRAEPFAPGADHPARPPLRSFNRAKRSRARAAASWAARSILSRSSRSRTGPASPHSPLEHPTPAGITFVARTPDSRGLTFVAQAPRPSSASHPALDLPKGTGNENADAGCPNVRIHVSRKNSYTSMPQGRAGQGVRLCDPAPAPHSPSRARQLHATRCARRAE